MPESFSQGKTKTPLSGLSNSLTNKSPFILRRVPHRGGAVPGAPAIPVLVRSEAFLGPEGAGHPNATGQRPPPLMLRKFLGKVRVDSAGLPRPRCTHRQQEGVGGVGRGRASQPLGGWIQSEVAPGLKAQRSKKVLERSARRTASIPPSRTESDT